MRSARTARQRSSPRYALLHPKPLCTPSVVYAEERVRLPRREAPTFHIWLSAGSD